MNIVDLQTAALSCRLDLDDPVSLERAAVLLEGAESVVLSHLETTFEDLSEDYPEMPFAIKAAVMVVLLNLHDTPDEDPLSQAAVNLLFPYRTVGVF